jgi:hypothetical protein
MLTIHLDTTPLILPANLKIRAEINTPYFDTEAVAVSVVWHFDVPIEGNEEAFKYVHLLPIRQKNHTHQVQMQLNGYTIGRGTLVVTNCTAKNYRVVITLSTFYEAFNGVTLNQAPFESVVIGGNPHMQMHVINHAYAMNAAATANYRFPMVYAPAFYGDDNDNGRPENNIAYNRYLNNYGGDGLIANTENLSANTLVPMPHLMPVLHKIAALKGYSLSGSIPAHPELQQLLMMNRVSIDEFDFDYKVRINLPLTSVSLAADWAHLPYTFLEASSENQQPGEDKYNCMFNGYYTCKQTGMYEVGAIPLVAPPATCLDFVLSIGIIINGVLAFSSNESRSFGWGIYRAIIDIETPLTEGDIVDFQIRCYDNGLKKYVTMETASSWFIQGMRIVRTDAAKTNIYQNTLQLGNHIPEKSVLTVFNTIRNLFFGALFFDDDFKTIELSFIDDILANNGYVDITRHLIIDENESEINQTFNPKLAYTDCEKLSDVADTKLLKQYDYASELEEKPNPVFALMGKTNEVYQFSSTDENVAPTWKYYGHNFQPSRANADSEATEITLDVAVVPAIAQGGRIFPYSTQMGVSQINPDVDDEPPLQLFFWRGEQNWRPVAIPSNFIEGNLQLGNLSLDMNAENGIIQTFGRRWLNFLSNYELVTERLTNVDEWLMADLMGLIKPNATKRWLMINSVKCLPKQMSFIINVKGEIEECEIIAVKSNAI